MSKSYRHKNVHESKIRKKVVIKTSTLFSRVCIETVQNYRARGRLTLECLIKTYRYVVSRETYEIFEEKEE